MYQSFQLILKFLKSRLTRLILKYQKNQQNRKIRLIQPNLMFRYYLMYPSFLKNLMSR
jgi:hypothetical protein